MTLQPKDFDFEAVARRNQRTGLMVLGLVVLMVGMVAVSVPLYRLFCQVTGLGGQAVASPDSTETRDRFVQVNFNADTDSGLPWTFKPEQRTVKIQVGVEGLTAYYARNLSNRETTGTAVFNVTPEKAGKYFHKIQCFCFGEQMLKPGESANMPVVFYIDAAFADNPDMADVTTLTLSYTFYRAESDALTRALDRLTGRSSPVADKGKIK